MRLFVGVKTSSAPADSATLRLSIPIGGIQTASDNDGPVDGTIPNAEALVFSTAPLLATLSIPAALSTVDQDFQVQMTVRNVSSEAVSSIVPSALAVSGDAGFALVSGPDPATLDLAPGASSSFAWTCPRRTELEQHRQLPIREVLEQAEHPQVREVVEVVALGHRPCRAGEARPDRE